MHSQHNIKFWIFSHFLYVTVRPSRLKFHDTQFVFFFLFCTMTNKSIQLFHKLSHSFMFPSTLFYHLQWFRSQYVAKLNKLSNGVVGNTGWSKVSVHSMITIQNSDAQKHFDHPVQFKIRIFHIGFMLLKSRCLKIFKTIKMSSFISF